MLLLATIFIALPSCSDDKDEPDAGLKEQIIGTWDATDVKFDDSDWLDITNRPSLAVSISFNKDGRYYSWGALGEGDGTYTIKGNTIKTYIDGELIGTYVVKSISGNRAELSFTMGNTTMEFKAKKR